MSQASHRGSNQEVMQPVWVILQAVEVVKRRHPHRLVTPQARAIRRKVPLQRHGAYRQPCARGGGVAVAHGVEPPVLRVAQPIDRMRGAVRLWTIRGGGEVGPTAAPLQHHLGHGPAEVQRRPLGHAPQTLRTLPFGRRLRDLPGPVESLVPQLARAVFLPLQDRVENTPHQRERGTEPAPRLARGFPAIGAYRARLISWHKGLGFPSTKVRQATPPRRAAPASRGAANPRTDTGGLPRSLHPHGTPVCAAIGCVSPQRLMKRRRWGAAPPLPGCQATWGESGVEPPTPPRRSAGQAMAGRRSATIRSTTTGEPGVRSGPLLRSPLCRQGA